MIGIFGGTFDPVHYGHLRAALEVKEIFRLDEVRLIPSAQPPHRPPPKVSSAMRLEMLQLAAAIQPGFIVDTREIDRAGESYMVMTLESLRQDFPDQPLLLFVGSDAFNRLHTWYLWRQLFDFAHVVVLTRPGYLIGQLDEFYISRQTSKAGHLMEHLAGKLYFQIITQLDISATAIRKMIASRISPRFLMPEAVLTYIYEHQLYKS